MQWSRLFVETRAARACPNASLDVIVGGGVNCDQSAGASLVLCLRLKLREAGGG